MEDNENQNENEYTPDDEMPYGDENHEQDHQEQYTEAEEEHYEPEPQEGEGEVYEEPQQQEQYDEMLPETRYEPQDEDGYYEDEDEVEITEEKSQLASHPGRNVLLLALIVVGCAVALYFILFAGKEAPKTPEEEQQQQAVVNPKDVRQVPAQGAAEPNIGVVNTPAAPEVTNVENLEPPSVPGEQKPAAPDDISDFNQQPPDFFGSPTLPVQDVQTPVETKPQQPTEPALPEPAETAPITPLPDAANTERLPTPEEQQAYEQRRKASIMVLSGGGLASETGAATGNNAGGGGLFGGGNAKPDPDVLAHTAAEQTIATEIGDLSRIIAQGKIIDAVLETAINTDLPGVLRAVVSRDVYAESGKNILVPKGSRLIGNYEADVKDGQSRVYVIWTRVIRPDGVDVAINAPGVDELGRSGVSGTVDKRYMEIFGNAILLSTLTVMGAYALETVTNSTSVNNTTSSGTNGTTSSSSTGTPTSFAISEAATDLSDTAKDLIKGAVNTKPRITVPQGTSIKVLVNADMIFPPSAAQSVRFVK